MSNLSALRTLALLAAIGFASAPTVALAQTESSQHDHAAAQQQDQMKMKQMKGQMKMPSMEELAARKKVNTERIVALMAQVKKARGDERTAAMAELIGILVEERAAMQQHCAEMHAMMAK
jgi:hypothetical protein